MKLVRLSVCLFLFACGSGAVQGTDTTTSNDAAADESGPPYIETLEVQSSSNGLGIGATFDLLLSLSKQVFVDGDPLLVFHDDSVDRVATYYRGSASSTLVFHYTVQVDDTNELIATIGSANFDWEAGSILDGGGRSLETRVDPSMVELFLSDLLPINIDGVVPHVVGLSGTDPDGMYKNGDTIEWAVTFDEDVTVSGTPILSLASDSGSRQAHYVSGSDSSILIFAYTITDSDVSAHFNAPTGAALLLTSASIVDAVGNPADVEIATSLIEQLIESVADVFVDGVAPTVMLVSSTDDTGTYRIGDVLSIVVQLSETVTILETPQLLLNTRPIAHAASYSSGNGSNVLTFLYTVTENERSSQLNYNSTDALLGTLIDSIGNAASLTLPDLESSNALSAAGENIWVIDGFRPTVESVSSADANGTYLEDSILTIDVNFSESVTIDGALTLTLDLDDGPRAVAYSGGSGTSVVSFAFTVQAGDNTERLSYVNEDSLQGADSVMDDAGNSAILALPATSDDSSLGHTTNFLIDTNAPEVLSVSSDSLNGTYLATQVIDIHVLFSEIVNVIGTPLLTLETGATDRTVNYVSGSGSSTLVFVYTVQGGDTSRDLDYGDINSLTLNGGSIRDDAMNNANTTLPIVGDEGSLSYFADFEIGDLPVVTQISSSKADGSYGVGSILPITVSYSGSVSVTGTPSLTLETGATDRVANFASSSNASTLVFLYTVQAGDVSADLDCQSTNALDIAGDSIQDESFNNVATGLPVGLSAGSLPTNKNIIIDTLSPTVTNIASSTSNGTYGPGSLINIEIVFSERIFANTATPSLTLETGSTDRVANYISAGTSSLFFRYTIQSGDNSADLDVQASNALVLIGGSVRDTAGNNATLTLPTGSVTGALARNQAFVIDSTAPTVLDVSSNTINGIYVVPDVIDVRVTFSETVYVTGTPRLTLETGAVDRVIYYVSGSGSPTLVFLYTVQAGDSSADLDYVGVNSLTEGSGTIKDIALNRVSTTLPLVGEAGSLSDYANFEIGERAHITLVSSTLADGSYLAGSVIPITVAFSSGLTVTGTPTLNLETGETSRTVNYASTSNSSVLVFLYTIQAGDTSSDLDYTNESALDASGATLRDSALRDAILELPTPGTAGALGDSKNFVVDTTAPTVTTVTSSTANGTYGASSAAITIQVNFSEPIEVTGSSPILTLETGSADYVATYLSSGTSTLYFSYTIQAGDVSDDLDVQSTDALELSSSTVKDPAGNDAVLTLPLGSGTSGALANDKNLVVDGVAPTVAWITSSKSDGAYTTGTVISIQVAFSENVNVTGSPRLTLETGATDRAVVYSTGSGTSTLTFSYTVQNGDTSADLDCQSSSGLSPFGGTIRDAALNNATLTLPVTTNPNSLASQKNLVIDTTVPNDVTALYAFPKDQHIALLWTAPTGSYSGYLVLRHTVSNSDAPSAGTSYSMGDSVGTSLIAYKGTSIEISDEGLTNDTRYYYKVYSYDDANNYSAANTISTVANLSWTPHAFLKAPSVDSGDVFGNKMAMSSDTLVVGAPNEDSNLSTISHGSTASTDNSNTNSGAVYVFKNTDGTWSQEAFIKAANSSVLGDKGYGGSGLAISGDTIAVGAYIETLSSTTLINGSTAPITPTAVYQTGAVYIYRRSGVSWQQEAYIKPEDGLLGHFQFGSAIALDGDWMAVGYGSGTSVRIFNRTGTSWARSSGILPTNNGASDLFGSALAMSGNTLVVGANREDSNWPGVHNGTETSTDNVGTDSGAVYVYVRSGTSWTQEAMLKANYPVNAFQLFGFSVAISGDTIVVGETGNAGTQTTITNGTGGPSGASSGSGAAYVFHRSGGTWAVEAYIKPPNTGASDAFGYSVAIDGDRIIVGAYAEDSNQRTVTMGSTASSDNSSTDSGAAYVFKRIGTSWFNDGYVKQQSTAAAGGYFGYSVRIAGSTIAVGVDLDSSGQSTITHGYFGPTDSAKPSSGAASIFTLE